MDKNMYVVLSALPEFKEPLSGSVHSIWTSKRKAYKELTMQCYSELNELKTDLDVEKTRESLNKSMNMLVEDLNFRGVETIKALNKSTSILVEGLNDNNIQEFYKYASIAIGGYDYSTYHGIAEVSISKLNIDFQHRYTI